MIPANSFLSLLSPTGPKGAKGDAPAAAEGFSALFAAVTLPGMGETGTAPDQVEPKADPAALLAQSLAASGKPAAQPGKSGKILPLPLPPGNSVPAGEGEADALATPEEEQAEALAADQSIPAPAPLALLAPQTAPVAAPLLTAAVASAETADTHTPLPAAVVTVLAPAQSMPSPASTPQAAPDRAAASTMVPAAGQQQDARPAVILQVASQPVASAAKAVAAVTQQAVPQPMPVQPPVPQVAAPVALQPLAAAVVAELAPAETRPRQPGKALGHAAAPAMASATGNPLQAPLLADAATPFPLMPVQAAQQAPAAAGQDLAAIVDRLSAAREALAPATAALSIDHAEFGALSLKFDQQADGALTVQLAAATPEAHRAISAAMGAEGGQFLSAEGQPQPQMQTPQQQQQQTAAQPGTSSGTGTGSSTFAERDARNGQQPQRQDSSPRQQQAQRQPAAPRNLAQGDGIFA